MSSRILSGAKAAKVRPMAWRKLGPNGEPLHAYPPEDGPCGAAPGVGTAELEARIRELEAEISLREQRARQEGLRQGEQQARKQLEAPLREALERLTAHLEELAAVRRNLRREAEQDLVRLAIAVAHRILRRQLLADPEAILGIVKAALDRVDARDILRVRVVPDDAGLVRDLLAARGLPAGIEVVPDPGLERGAFLIDTSRGTLDASVTTQLQEIECGLADLVRSHSS